MYCEKQTCKRKKRQDQVIDCRSCFSDAGTTCRCEDVFWYAGWAERSLRWQQKDCRAHQCTGGTLEYDVGGSCENFCAGEWIEFYWAEITESWESFMWSESGIASIGREKRNCNSI